MTEMTLPPRTPRFCFDCGEKLAIVELDSRPDEAHGVLRCPRCGSETGFGWSTGKDGPLETTWITDETGTTHLAPSQGGLSVDADDPMTDRGLPPEDLQDPWVPDAEQDGISSLLEIAGFPVFGLSAGSLQLNVSGYSLQSDQRPTDGRPRIQTVTLWYEGPRYGDPLNIVRVESGPRATGTEPTESQGDHETEEDHNAITRLAEVIENLPSAQGLVIAGAVYQFVNIETLKNTPPSTFRASYPPEGEAIWDLKALKSPVPMAYAVASIGGARVSLAAAGPVAASGVHSLLRALTRIAPGSPQANEWDAGYHHYHEFMSTGKPPATA